MKRQAAAAIVTVMTLALVVAPSSQAEGPIDDAFLGDMLSGVTAEQVEFCVPEAGYCQYYTYLDNEDNHGTGSADDDMGCLNPPDCTAVPRTCQSDAKHPIEFHIGVSAITYDTDAILLVGAKEPAQLGGIARIEFNGTLWEVEREDRHPDREVVLWIGHVDPTLVEANGDVNLMKVYLRSGECLQLFQGWLLMTDWPFEIPAEEEFVPEPGTVMLLGTGLAGLAGYATLRWRTRE